MRSNMRQSKGLRERGYEISSIDVIPREDDFNIDLNLITSILTYFEVSVKRISDYVPMFIEHEFLGKFGTKLRKELSKKLSLSLTDEDDEKICAMFMIHDSELSKRNALIAKRTAFRNALKTFKHFQTEGPEILHVIKNANFCSGRS